MQVERKSGADYRKEIRELLEGVQKSNRADVEVFSRGHLNESNLYKPPEEKSGGVRWQGANKSSLSLVPASSRTTPRKVNTKEMTDTLKNFSLGTAGMALPYVSKTPRKRTSGPVQVARVTSASSQGSYSRLDDGILIEDMGNAETMVLNTKGWAYEELLSSRPSPRPKFSQADENVKNLSNLKQNFIPSHMMGITKLDQFSQMKKFEATVLKKGDLLDQNSLSTSTAVEHLEAKLQELLDRLEYNSYGPNFHRLQIYSDVFEDLIEESATFKFLLGLIKKEYDDYISSLLDQQPSRHKLLQDQVDQLSARGTSDISTLKQEQQNLSALEEEARNVLEERERLKSELEDEKQLGEEETDAEELDTGPGETAEPVDLSEKIEEVRHQILEKLDQIHELRATLRKSFVPSTVVTHLEQCIKETEIEIQRYMSQKDFYDQSIAELESELTKAIQEADTTDRDARKIWKKINSKSAGASDEHDDDEQKWDWYIS